MGRERNDQIVIQSSIALLQERFRQLQRAKEMRAERELLKVVKVTVEPRPIYHNDDHLLTTAFYNCEAAATRAAFSFIQFLPIKPHQCPQQAGLQNNGPILPSLWSKERQATKNTLGSVPTKLDLFLESDEVDTSLHL